MPRKQITQFPAASSIALTDRFLLQQGATGTAFTHGTITQLLNGGLASTYASVAVNGSVAPANGIYLSGTNTLGIAVASNLEVQLTPTALSPGASDGSALGTSSLMWSDLFLAAGGAINWNAGNVTMTHSAGTLTVSGALAVTGDLSVGTAKFSVNATTGAITTNGHTWPSYDDDAAAATGGVGLGEVYSNGGFLMVRRT